MVHLQCYPQIVMQQLILSFTHQFWWSAPFEFPKLVMIFCICCGMPTYITAFPLFSIIDSTGNSSTTLCSQHLSLFSFLCCWTSADISSIGSSVFFTVSMSNNNTSTVVSLLLLIVSDLVRIFSVSFYYISRVYVNARLAICISNQPLWTKQSPLVWLQTRWIITSFTRVIVFPTNTSIVCIAHYSPSFMCACYCWIISIIQAKHIKKSLYIAKQWV